MGIIISGVKFAGTMIVTDVVMQQYKLRQNSIKKVVNNSLVEGQVMVKLLKKKAVKEVNDLKAIKILKAAKETVEIEKAREVKSTRKSRKKENK